MALLDDHLRDLPLPSNPHVLQRAFSCAGQFTWRTQQISPTLLFLRRRTIPEDVLLGVSSPQRTHGIRANEAFFLALDAVWFLRAVAESEACGRQRHSYSGGDEQMDA